MPFYDEFDLSTVDVLLISQYVFVYSALLWKWDLAHHWIRTIITQWVLHKSASCISQSMEYYLQLIRFDFGDVPCPRVPPICSPLSHRLT